MKTLACRSVSYGSSYTRSTSFGEILHFLPLPGNKTNGLQLNFTSRSASCYDQTVKKYRARQTVIQMICDMTKGAGQPEISDNSTLGKQGNKLFAWNDRFRLVDIFKIFALSCMVGVWIAKENVAGFTLYNWWLISHVHINILVFLETDYNSSLKHGKV